MRVLLIYPEPDIAAFYLQSPIGCLYLGAALEEDGHEVSVYDAVVDSRTLDSVVEDFDPDVIGVSFTTGCLQAAFRIVGRYRETGRILIAGGAHPTSEPQSCLDAGFDVVGRGESEDTLPEILELLRTGRLTDPGQSVPQGYYFRNSLGEVVDTGVARCEDVNRYEPARHLLRDEYHAGYSHGVLMGSRGCVFRCVFCLSARTGFRERHVESVVDELEYVINVEGHKAVHFCDDIFTFKPKWVIEICKEIIARGLEFRWSVNSRSDIPKSHWEMFDWLARAGCEIVAFGVESGDQVTLNASGKNCSVPRITPVVERARAAGLGVRCNLIVGLPKADFEAHVATIDMMEKLLPDQIVVNLNTPYPGTAEAADPERYGVRILTDDWTTMLQNVYVDVHKFGQAIEFELITTEEIVLFVEKLLKRLAPHGYTRVGGADERDVRPDRVIKTFLDRPKMPPLRDQANRADVYHMDAEPDWVI